MGSPAVPARTFRTLRLLQTSCGLLALASLVALGRPSPAIVTHDGAATVATAHPAVPTEWAGVGQLEIPTIGVVPPGTEDWFDPQTEPVFPSSGGSPLDGRVPTAAAFPPATSSPATEAAPGPLPTPSSTPPATSASASTSTPASPTAHGTETAATGTRPTTTEAETTEAQTTEAQPTEAQTTGPETTASQTTTPQATSPEATPGTTAPPSTTEPAPSAAEPPPAPPAPRTNERGNVPLAVGEELTVFDDETGAAAFTIAVDSISEANCTDPASTPATNGRLIALLVHVTTGPDLSAVGDEPEVRAVTFRFRAPDGEALDKARTHSSDACLPDTEKLPKSRVAPGQEVTGMVVLDVPTGAGTLVFAPGFLPVGAEWELGPSAAG